MLEQMHRHMKWIMWLIVVLVTVTFLFFGIYPSDVAGRTVAKVDGYVITADDYNRVYQNMYENYRQLFKDQMNDNLVKMLRSQALQQLIENRLLVQESEKQGIRITDEELQAYIMQIPSFSPQGKFDKRIYERALQNINMTPAVFEASQREYLKRQKLERLVQDGVAVIDAELAAAYAARNPKAKKGDYEKNKESFKRTLLDEKQRDALDVFVKSLKNKAEIKIKDRELAS